VTIYGWDMSHFDAPSIGNAVDQGIRFMTHKAGGDANDAELGAWWNGVKGQRPDLLLGAYWVLYPGTPVARADMFIARLDSQCPGWRNGPFILQADCEEWGGNPGTVPTITEINTFCDRLAARLPNLTPIVYAPQWVYGNSVSALRYPLWASAYVTGSGSFKSLYPGDSASQWSKYGGRTPDILQYTSSATIGGQSTCDANAFRGTLQQLIELLAPGWVEDMTTVDLTPAALTAIEKLFEEYIGFDKAQDDGTPTSRIGRLVWTQGVPDGTAPAGSPRALAYVALQNLGEVAVGSTAVDPAAVASALIAAGFNPAALAAALLDAIAAAS
jgi:hypothetical protein